MKQISIIMGVYNGEKTIERAVRSILIQDFSDWEFIICDDGSVDNTRNIISKSPLKPLLIINLMVECQSCNLSVFVERFSFALSMHPTLQEAALCFFDYTYFLSPPLLSCHSHPM